MRTIAVEVFKTELKMFLKNVNKKSYGKQVFHHYVQQYGVHLQNISKVKNWYSKFTKTVGLENIEIVTWINLI